jgi:ADP-ribose pyrophosphatase YjhB (NUDIX family)
MESRKTVSVWLELKDDKNKGKFALQKRSENHFPFICQATWAGKVEENESLQEAIIRECEEELGTEFKNNFDFLSLKAVSVENFEMTGKNWESHNYTVKISEQKLMIAKIHQDSEPQFVFAGKNSLIFPISSVKDPKENIILFDDQYKVLKNILNNENK